MSRSAERPFRRDAEPTEEDLHLAGVGGRPPGHVSRHSPELIADHKHGSPAARAAPVHSELVAPGASVLELVESAEQDFSTADEIDLTKLIRMCTVLKSVLLQLQATTTVPIGFPKFPEIVVVGDQSSGKSSVLESILQTEFLPRGDGIVTRRPLAMTLENRHGPDEVKFHGNPKSFKPEEVSKEIIRLTDAKCPGPEEVSPQVIRMTYYSSKVLDLTLIDLPGRRTAPPAVATAIDAMIREHASSDQAIILAIHPAFLDAQASTALEMASELDPQGKRTLCVLTKIDLVQTDPEAQRIQTLMEPFIHNTDEIKHSTKFPCQLGYVPVRCRSQDELDNKVTSEEALKKEREFFASPSKNWSKYKAYCGTEHLSHRLQRLLLERILSALPQWQRHIERGIEERQAIVDCYVTDRSVQGICRYASKVIRDFSEALKGHVTGDISRIRLKAGETAGLTQIEELVRNKVNGILVRPREAADFDEDHIKRDLQSAGETTTDVFNDAAFFAALRRVFHALEPQLVPSALTMVEELHKLVTRVQPKTQYRNLNAQVCKKARAFLDQRLQLAEEFIRQLVRLQHHINLFHPDFGPDVRQNIACEVLGLPLRPVTRTRHGPTFLDRPSKVKEDASVMPVRIKPTRKVTDPKEAQLVTDMLMVASNPETKEALVLGARAVTTVPLESRETSVRILQKMCLGYYNVVASQLADQIYKCLRYKLLDPVCKDLEGFLKEEILLAYSSDSEKLNMLVFEDAEAKSRSEQVQHELKVYQGMKRLLASFTSGRTIPDSGPKIAPGNPARPAAGGPPIAVASVIAAPAPRPVSLRPPAPVHGIADPYDSDDSGSEDEPEEVLP